MQIGGLAAPGLHRLLDEAQGVANASTNCGVTT